MNAETTVTKSFSKIIQSGKPVLVDFYTEWCGPCKMMTPILKELKNRMGEKLSILKVDVDRNQAAAQNWQVQGVPTLILFRNGRAVWRQAGVVPVNSLQQVVEKYI